MNAPHDHADAISGSFGATAILGFNERFHEPMRAAKCIRAKELVFDDLLLGNIDRIRFGLN
jgi:hypothetical protein